MTNEELVQKLDEMQLKIDRLEAVTICANLMSRYVNYHAAFRHKDYVEFWAKRDDDILEMPWGKYLGFENVKKCYLDHHFDRGDEGAEEKMKGAVFFHHLDTPIIEVAADGKTARGAWWSPDTRPSPRRPRARSGRYLGLEQVWRGLHQGGRRLEDLAYAHLPHVQDSRGHQLDRVEPVLRPHGSLRVPGDRRPLHRHSLVHGRQLRLSRRSAGASRALQQLFRSEEDLLRRYDLI